MKVYLEYGDYGNFQLIAENGKSILIQTDWDYPGIASIFGWTPCPDCRSTDGTVDCEHRTASEMIAEAREFLDGKIGCFFEDPGFFEAA